MQKQLACTVLKEMMETTWTHRIVFFFCFFLPTEEYEAYMKKQEAMFKTEVTSIVQEPKVGDIPPVTVTTMEKITTTIISGQVENP